MNYLAHLLVSEPTPDGWAGAVLGDFVRGDLDASALAHWPSALRRSVRLHRAVDAYTDAHPLHARSRARFSPPLRRFAGIVVDLGYDHFLARDYARYSAESLADYAAAVYAALPARYELMPAAAKAMCQRMIAADWLGQYAEASTLPTAFRGVSARLRRQPNALADAGPAFTARYDALADDFAEFWPDLVQFAQGWPASLEQPPTH